MDILLIHLQKTAEKRDLSHAPQPLLSFLDRFRFGQQSSPEHYQLLKEQNRYAPLLVLQTTQALLKEDQLQILQYDGARGLLTARVEHEYHRNQGWFATVPLRSEKLRLYLEVFVKVDAHGRLDLTANAPLESWVDELKVRLSGRLAQTPEWVKQTSGQTQHATTKTRNTVLRPGGELSGPFHGTLRDYSGCADKQEVNDLHQSGGGALPLGRWTFGTTDTESDYGEMLYLNSFTNTGALREHNGTLICAPQNSGKTELIVRWAKAANQAGYNLLLIDVKGNLHERLAGADWQGELYYFSTDPRDQQSDAVNFLDGLDPTTPEGSSRVRQLADALLPSEGYESGDNRRYRQHWLNWLTAMIQLVLLDGRYYPDEERPRDLSDVYALVSDEQELIACLERIDHAEVMQEKDGHAPLFPGLKTLFNDVAALLPPLEFTRADPEQPPLYGQRAEYTYRWLTEELVGALRPFGPQGTLSDKTSGFDARRHFQFEWIADVAEEEVPDRGQVTVIVAAREQDLDDARSVLSLSVTKLQHALFERMQSRSRQRKQRPVLLLLDETRRIRNFKTNEYVSFARQAEAGCVVVYQSLDQIGDERQIIELLENVGTQIYLGSLVGNTAKYFVASLPKRFRPTYSLSSTIGNEGSSNTLQTGQEMVDYFTTADLYVLPAGRYPALVYLNDQPRRKPFLVTMDRDVTGF
jgi:hypothetical protein